MQPVKLGGLTLKSEEKKEDVEEIVDSKIEMMGKPASKELVASEVVFENETFEYESTLQDNLRLIIKRVEEFPKDDNTIKAIGKLKGALQLLS